MAPVNRRKFLQSSFALPALSFTGIAAYGQPAKSKAAAAGNRFKISLNAYSFNTPLTAGKTTLEEVVKFCAAQDFDAVDVTGYYFPGYPQTPPDEYVYRLKKLAHASGVAISGTGIRNDFSLTDKAARMKEVELVKQWIEVAAKLGAPVIRIFTGKSLPENHTWAAAAGSIAEHLRTCVQYGKEHGIVVAVQNHNDFIKTAGQAIDMISMVNSEWFGLVLDTGSFVTEEPYAE